MPQSRKHEFRAQASLSQKLSHLDPIFQKLAGADPEISESIGFLEVLGEQGYVDLEEPGAKLLMGLLQVKRKARFATSERTNEITKMGLMMPKKDEDVDFTE